MSAQASIMPRRVANGTTSVGPQLTSLVDMMVILLVFLLKSFSVEGQLVTPAADLQLPVSEQSTTVEAALSVEVTTSGINLDGRQLVDLASVMEKDSLLIEILHDELVGLTTAGSLSPDQRQVTIQCDKRIDFRILKRVLYTCNQAEYDDLSLLVLSEAS